MEKILIIGIIIILMCLFIYCKKDKNIELFINNDDSIETQIKKGISQKLKISIRRIENINFTGDIDKQQLNISFTILEPNIIEMRNNESNAKTIAILANQLLLQRKFIIKINNINVLLLKLNNNFDLNNNKNKEVYFNNTGLDTVIDHTKFTFDSIKNEPELTDFYTLQINPKFNIQLK